MVQVFPTSINRFGRNQLERPLLGGFRTHKEEAPFHGAHELGLSENGLFFGGQKLQHDSICVTYTSVYPCMSSRSH